jgi:hypothetical protein
MNFPLPRTYVKLYLEARYYDGLTNNTHTSLVPITFGIAGSRPESLGQTEQVIQSVCGRGGFAQWLASSFPLTTTPFAFQPKPALTIAGQYRRVRPQRRLLD